MVDSDSRGGDSGGGSGYNYDDGGDKCASD